MRKNEHEWSAEKLVHDLSRDEVRAKLLEAGILVSDLGVKDIEPVSDEELERTGDMRPGALSSEALVSQDRG
jgi:hypothetical protein